MIGMKEVDLDRDHHDDQDHHQNDHALNQDQRRDHDPHQDQNEKIHVIEVDHVTRNQEANLPAVVEAEAEHRKRNPDDLDHVLDHNFDSL